MEPQTINEYMTDLCDLTEHFIHQEMPDRSKEGDPWEQVVKDRLAAEIAGSQDYRRVVAALLFERTTGLDVPEDALQSSKITAILDYLAARDRFEEIINEMANAIFKSTMQSLLDQGNAAMEEILTHIENQTTQE
ncbi:hypothetical protein ACN4DJ_06355 [Corynebacterium macclintockiae]|uniref:Uncharacterized protein n=1 Tax=Corynebacterium urealyticum TaxID=43771 RepID=A0A2W5B6Y3_9CORY|nr:MAG: hypothetical protein DI609_04055 [Corynebacterium urealyticum]